MKTNVEELQKIADYFAEAKLHEQEQVILEAIRQMGVLEKGLNIYERERQRFRHAKPEITGAFFLTGGHGEKDDNMLPEFVTVCPAYGCAWEQVYQKTDRTISYEGS
jgi:hypothetical protein